jgi:hypothetical protein
MINKVSAIAISAVALSAVLGSTAVQAQESCPAMYSHMMGIYQANPYSPEYAQMLGYYNSRCLSGASYQSPQQPYPDPAYSQYQQPAPYGYVDPGAAIVGAAIIGGAIAAGSHEDNWGNHGWHR